MAQKELKHFTVKPNSVFQKIYSNLNIFIIFFCNLEAFHLIFGNGIGNLSSGEQ